MEYHKNIAKERLKPCPFCGSDQLTAYVIQPSDSELFACFIWCQKCGAQRFPCYGEAEHDAAERGVEQWNRRAEA